MIANFDKDWDIQLQQFKRKRTKMAPCKEDRYFVLMNQKRPLNEASLFLLKQKAGKNRIARINLQNFKKSYASFRKKSSKKTLLVFTELRLAWLYLEKPELKKVLQIPDILVIPESGTVGTGVSKFAVERDKKNQKIDNWGVHTIGALSSKYTGKGVKIAVLDTGFDEKHPSFRPCVKTEYFIGGSATDDNGHGMHCTGIACGASRRGTRLGVATNVEVYAGKILDKNKEGWPKDMILGMYWALANSCHVILLALGFPLNRNVVHPLHPVLTRVFQLAKANRSIVVAAAGNDSKRLADPPIIHPMLSPAEHPLVVGIGAITRENDILSMSNGAHLLGDGYQQKMDYVAPGEGIYSIWSTQAKHDYQEPYGYQDGTSMAAAFVAGVICLYWEKFLKLSPRLNGVDPLHWIRKEMNKSTKPPRGPFGRAWKKSDSGKGMVFAPNSKKLNQQLKLT